MNAEQTTLHLVGRDCLREEAAFALSLAERQIASGMKAIVGCQEKSWCEKRASEAGIPLETMSLSSSINPFEWRRVGKVAQSVKATRVHSHDQVSTAVANHAPLPPSCSHIAGIYRRIAKSAPYDKTAAAFYSSEFAVSGLSLPDGANFHLAYPGWETEKARLALENREKDRARLHAEFCPEKEKPLFLFYCADFTEHNSHNLLLEAMPDILAKLPQVHLFLAGDGDQLPELERQARIMALENDVAFIEVDDNPYDTMCSVDIYVSPQQNDAAGFMVLAAMACGRAVAAAESGLYPELIEPDKTGVLVREQTADAYGRTLLEVLHNRNRREHYGRMAAAKAAKCDIRAVEKTIAKAMEAKAG